MISGLRNIAVLRLLLPYLAGIVVQSVIKSQAGVFFFAVIVLPLLAMPFIRRANWDRPMVFGLWVCLAFFGMGMGQVWYREHRLFRGYPGAGESVLTCRISRTPVPRARSTEMEVKLEALFDNHHWTRCKGKILCYFRGDTLPAGLLPGDRLVVKAIIHEKGPAMNPGQFDYARHLGNKGICGTAYVPEGNWMALSPGKGWNLTRMAARIRNGLLEVYRRYGTGEDAMQILAALTLGARDSLSEETSRAFASAGIVHILAVSGLHLGMVYLFLGYLLSFFNFLKRGRWMKTILILLGIWLFALVTGFAPSVQRAATMFSFFAFAGLLRRETSIYNVLASSAFVLLLVNPRLLFEPGFQLSYAAVIGIVYFYGEFSRKVRFRFPFVRKVVALVVVAIAAQLATFPVSVYYFHQFPVYFLVSNVIAIPLATVIIFTSLSLFMLSFLPWLSACLAWVLDKGGWMLHELTVSVEKWPGAVISGLHISLPDVFVLYCLIVTAVVFVRTRKPVHLVCSLGCLLVLSVSVGLCPAISKRKAVFTVYHVPYRSVACFSCQGKAYVISDHTRFGEWKQISYSLQGDWNRRDISVGRTIFLRMSDTGYGGIRSLSDQLAGGQGFFLFRGTSFYFYRGQQLPERPPDIPFEPDVLIVGGNSKMPDGMFTCYRPGIVVLDSSVRALIEEEWLRACRMNGTGCYSVNRAGAFVMRLGQNTDGV